MGRPRALRVTIFLAVLAVCVAGALLVVAYKGGRIVTDDAYVAATVYEIQPRVPGSVLSVEVADNEAVPESELLVRLDSDRPRILVRAAEAALATARMHHQEAQVAVLAARAEVQLVQAQLEKAKKDLARYQALWNKRTVAEEQYDQAVTQVRVLSSQAEAARAKADLAATRVETGLAAIQTAEARLDEARLRLQYTEIRAPGPGIVSKKNVEPGMVVQAGRPLMAVVDLAHPWVEANFKETQLGRIRPGLEAEIRADIYSGHVFHGRVESVEAGSGAAFSLFPPENATGNWVKVVQRVPVKIVLDHETQGPDAPELRLGMSLEVTVFPAEKPFLTRFFSFLPGF